MANDAVPLPPSHLNLTLPSSFAVPTSYTVRVDASAFPLGSFARDARRQRIGGESRISSEAGLRLLALASRAQGLGLPVSPNFVAESAGTMLLRTKEIPLTGLPVNYFDAFTVAPYQAGESKAAVIQAWQFVAAHDIARRINVAIVDGGFWLDTLGHPSKDGAGLSDLPDSPAQYDFLGNDRVADGDNPATCTDGATCRWHGNGSAGVAVGGIDNQTGAAGTGGQVGNPILFKVDLSDGQVKAALRTARAWGADIVSMSFSGNCNMWCRFGRNLSKYKDPFYDADAAGIALVAAAGNKNDDVVAENTWPCRLGPVVCVGALGDGSNTKIDYSNYGSVNMWAPTNITAMPNGDSPGSLITHGGTSASAPFVAGVMAMMRAMDPSLTGSSLNLMLQKTAWKDSPDPKVQYYVNAFLAVKEAANNRLPPDALEPNDTAGDAKALESGKTYDKLTIDRASDVDHHKFELSDYASLDLQLDYVTGLGLVAPALVRDGPKGGGSPSGVVTTVVPNRRTYHADVVAPGSYRWIITGAAPNIYILRSTFILVGLAPDEFEKNDTLTAAALPGIGEYAVNHHTALDPDYYAFTLTPIAVYQFIFSVLSSDWPVEVTLFNPDGLAVQTDSTTVAAPVGSSGTWRVQVRGDRSGRYTFGAYQTLDPLLKRIFVPFRKIPRRITPGDPPAISFFIEDSDRFFVFQHQANAGAALLNGDGGHLTLLDSNGRTLAEGRPFGLQQLGHEEIPLANLTPGEYYVLRVSRIEGGPRGSSTFSLAIHAGN
ncbi:MAG: S8/S53 family peptidase [Bryobacteraceae bacterium]